MAKIKLGALAGEVSGSIGCYTFSHNRGGPYVRLRNIPDSYMTPYAMAAKSRMALVSGNWKNLTVPIRASWSSWASANPVTDTLGERRPLTGSQAYCMLAARVHYAAGTLLSLPPGVPGPNALISASITAVSGTGLAPLVFATSPTGANIGIWVTGCYVDNASKLFVKKDLRLIKCTAGAATTPVALGADIISRLGSLVAGRNLVLQLACIDVTTGLISMPLQCRCIIS